MHYRLPFNVFKKSGDHEYHVMQRVNYAYLVIIMKQFCNNIKYKDSTVSGSSICKLAISECILPITDTTDMAISVPIPINISVHLYNSYHM